jgi:hypothetical protein
MEVLSARDPAAAGREDGAGLVTVKVRVLSVASVLPSLSAVAEELGCEGASGAVVSPPRGVGVEAEAEASAVVRRALCCACSRCMSLRRWNRLEYCSRR